MGIADASASSGNNGPTNTANAGLRMATRHQLFDFVHMGAWHINQEYLLAVSERNAHPAQVEMRHLAGNAPTESDLRFAPALSRQNDGE